MVLCTAGILHNKFAFFHSSTAEHHPSGKERQQIPLPLFLRVVPVIDLILRQQTAQLFRRLFPVLAVRQRHRRAAGQIVQQQNSCRSWHLLRQKPEAVIVIHCMVAEGKSDVLLTAQVLRQLYGSGDRTGTAAEVAGACMGQQQPDTYPRQQQCRQRPGSMAPVPRPDQNIRQAAPKQSSSSTHCSARSLPRC